MKWHSTMGVSTSPGRERIIEIMDGETMASMSTPFLRRVMMVVMGLLLHGATGQRPGLGGLIDRHATGVGDDAVDAVCASDARLDRDGCCTAKAVDDLLKQGLNIFLPIEGSGWLRCVVLWLAQLAG